jgi:hypothetical protein
MLPPNKQFPIPGPYPCRDVKWISSIRQTAGGIISAESIRHAQPSAHSVSIVTVNSLFRNYWLCPGFEPIFDEDSDATSETKVSCIGSTVRSNCLMSYKWTTETDLQAKVRIKKYY